MAQNRSDASVAERDAQRLWWATAAAAATATTTTTRPISIEPFTERQIRCAATHCTCRDDGVYGPGADLWDIGNNGGSWAFGTGMPMGSAGLQNNQTRQMGGGGNVSFAQSLSGSSPATPLDPS